MKPILFALVLLFPGPLGNAQSTEPADDWKASALNQPGREYPQVNSERRVRARVIAPEAQSVSFDFLGGGKYPLTKAEDGAWVGVTRPQDEGFHYYQLVIDGAQVPDPGTLYFYGGSRWGSAVEIPAVDQEFYALKNVPHGQLRETLYHSRHADAVLRCFVYTPPDYEQDPARRYPVLYLQHGGGEDETGWGRQGHAARIMDNLIAAGKAKPFIIVMANSYVPGAAPRGTPGPGGRRFDFSAFSRVLVEDLVPFIDANFRTMADQPHRAMAGLSMGGMQTRQITLANIDKFSHIGIFSGGSIALTNITDIAAFKEKVKVVFVSYGSRELGGDSGGGRAGFGGDPKANTEALKAAGINSHFYVSPDTGHEWQTWRRSLHAFAQLLFRDQPAAFQTSHQMTGATPASAATDITGTWKSEFDSQFGQQRYTFTFKQNGATLTGKANSEIGDRRREAELLEGRVDGNRISFVETLSFQGNEIRITYAGQLSTDGHEIRFTREVGEFARADIVAKRQQEEPAASSTSANIIRIKAGVAAPIKDADGNEWMADQGFAGGNTIARPTLPIDNTRTPDLYRAERYSMNSFTWRPLANGKYQVKLHFAETYEGINGPGERVFSFNIQGKEFKDFDVWAKAGGFARAYVESVPVDVTTGELKITFTPGIQNPQICAIEIIPQAGAPAASTTAATRRNNDPDLGPLPEILAAIPNNLPGLLGKPLKWKSSGVLVAPQNDPTHFLYSVKDPTVFRYNDRWHIYATAFMVSGPAAAGLLNPNPNQPTVAARRDSRGGWSMVHLSFADWEDAPNAELFYMDTVPGFNGYKCAPEVFYFAPQKKWYYIFQTQRPAYSTSETPDDPTSWTVPQQFFTPDIPTPRLPIDYHCIGDGEHMYLFFTGDDGNFYRSRTTYAEFPKGFDSPVIAMRGTRETVFEGSFTYKIKGANKYLTCVEALSPTRFYRAYVADTLDGEWYPIQGFDTFEKPFAGINNVTFEEGVEPWTGQISHGEMIREVNDERMILDPNNLLFLFQGIADADNRGDYGRLPYRLGLLRALQGD